MQLLTSTYLFELVEFFVSAFVDGVVTKVKTTKNKIGDVCGVEYFAVVVVARLRQFLIKLSWQALAGGTKILAQISSN